MPKKVQNISLVLTSVKVHDQTFKDFKSAALQDEFNIQKLVNRAMHMYLTDPAFKKQIQNHNKLVLFGSL